MVLHSALSFMAKSTTKTTTNLTTDIMLVLPLNPVITTKKGMKIEALIPEIFKFNGLSTFLTLTQTLRQTDIGPYREGTATQCALQKLHLTFPR